MSTTQDTASEKRSAQYDSGTIGGVGFGNKSSSDPSVEDDDTRFGKAQSHDPYIGGSKYGSAATAGAGAGNKSTAVSSADEVAAEDEEETRLGLSADTHPYSGATGYGSGSTAGVGYGNKTAEMGGGDSHDDSTSGRMMEKVGGIFGSQKMVEKGRAKREAARAEEGVDGESEAVDGEKEEVDVGEQRRSEAGWGKFATS